MVGVAGMRRRGRHGRVAGMVGRGRMVGMAGMAGRGLPGGAASIGGATIAARPCLRGALGTIAVTGGSDGDRRATTDARQKRS